jgi:aerobic C4-dicarboxylate transport protein
VVARWTGQLDRERLAEVLDNPDLVDTDALLRAQATLAPLAVGGDERSA